MKNLITPLLITVSFSAFAIPAFSAPCPSVNGCTNASNPNSAHIYFDRDVSLSSSATSALDINSSNTGARPIPRLTQAQIDLIASPALDLEVFNLDKNVEQYFDGSEWQIKLTAQHVTGSGSVTVTDDGSGNVDIFGSGGSAPDGAYSSFATQNNTSATSFPAINTYKPVVLGSSFSGEDSSDFSNSFMTIDSVSTPVMTYTGSATQAFTVHETFSIRGAVAVTATYKFCIAKRTAAGVVTVTAYCIPATVSDLVNFIPGPKLVGNVQLSQGDSVFAEVQNITNSNPIYAGFSNFSVSSISGSASLTLQNAYQNDSSYPQSRITFPSNGELSIINELNETVFDVGAHYGVYSEVGFSGSFSVGNFGIGINTVDQASTFFSVSPVNNDVGFGTLPYPGFSSAAESTIDLTHAPKGLSIYNIDTNTLDIYDGVIRKILSTNHLLGSTNIIVTDNGNGTDTISQTGLALDSAVVHNTSNETIAGIKTFSSTISGSISGNANTVTNGVVTTGSYADPSWLTSLSASKLTGTIPTAVLANIPKITVTSYLAAGSYTYTTPAGVTHICVQGWGSGAGGGGAAGTAGQTAAGSGGGGGAGFYKCISSPLSSYAVVVAAGGAGGTAGANNGSAGGTTTFGTSFLTAPGGNGGLGATASITATILQGGGTQGTATGGDLNSNGNPGGVSITLGSSATQVKAGDGGQGGLTGTIARGPMNADGAAGSFCGSGGSGGATSNATSRAGGLGYSGCIIVYEYYNG